MKTITKVSRVLTLALVLATGFAGVNRSAAADSPRARLTVTVHIHNNAEVDDKTLAEAEKVAMQIFRKAGVESRWVDDALTSENNNETLAHQGAFPLSHIWVSIYTGSMAERFGLPSEVMGFTPGKERNRQLVYVFYNRIEALTQSQLRARFEGSGRRPATTAQILGHVIAHELGHVLLNIASHSAIGLMRGGWNLKDLQNAACGCLLFTSQQAEVIRTDVFRRVTDGKMPQVARLETPKPER